MARITLEIYEKTKELIEKAADKSGLSRKDYILSKLGVEDEQ